MSTIDGVNIEGGSTTQPGCYSLNSTERASFYLRMMTNVCAPLTTGLGYCFGDGSGTQCPCGNNTYAGSGSGCYSSFGLATYVVGLGNSSLSNDTFVLKADKIPTSSNLFFQGDAAVNNGLGLPFGDGLRCVGGHTVRMGAAPVGYETTFPVSGGPTMSTLGQITQPGTRYYQVWYRNSASFCTPSTFNLTNAWTTVWTP